MKLYNYFLGICFSLWPLVVCLQALAYRKKQNSENPFTGGPISLPKAHWLSYTVATWFILPIFIYFQPALNPSLKFVLLIHLISWWTRGPLELIMIYKWLNWSPRYGISHDFFHIFAILAGILIKRDTFFNANFGSIDFLAMIYILFLFFSTSAEILFAFLFLKFRTAIEEQGNIYFASDEEKWQKINRITLLVVIVAYMHLVFQGLYSIFFILLPN